MCEISRIVVLISVLSQFFSVIIILSASIYIARMPCQAMALNVQRIKAASGSKHAICKIAAGLKRSADSSARWLKRLGDLSPPLLAGFEARPNNDFERPAAAEHKCMPKSVACALLSKVRSSIVEPIMPLDFRDRQLIRTRVGLINVR